MADDAGQENLQGGAAGLIATAEPAPVFISYATPDRPTADSVCAALESAGIPCWIAPRDVKPGALYADAIVRAITHAKALVLVLSENSIASPHVGKEVERASSKRRPIMALRIDAASLTPALEYFLSESQWIDALAGTREAGYAKLIDAIRDPHSTLVQHASLSRTHSSVPPKSHRKRQWLVAAFVVAALAVTTVIAAKWITHKQVTDQPPVSAGTTATSDKSIAVLPFTDMSEKHDQEYFGDGLAEQILNELSRIPALKVIGRTSSFRFRGNADDLREVGRSLGAVFVLEGSVRRSGDELRVTAQLINTRDGSNVWSQSYDRNSGSALKLQEEIATGIVRTLQVTITGGFKQQYLTTSPEAFDLFLRGTRDLDVATAESTRRAVTEFERASQLDPRFAPAVVGLADAYNTLAGNGYMATSEGYPRARLSIDRALIIDPRNADAYATRALIRVNYDRDWSGGAADIAKAQELGGSSVAYIPAAKIAGAKGDMVGAAEVYEAQLAADPLDSESLQDLGWFVYPALGRFDEADAVLHRASEVDPDYTNGVAYFAGINLLLRNRVNEAAALIDAEKDASLREVLRAAVDHARGRSRDSDAALKRAIAAPNAWSWAIARAYAYRGDKPQALEWLDRAAADHEGVLWTVRSDPMFRSLAGDEGFHAFLRKINILE